MDGAEASESTEAQGMHNVLMTENDWRRLSSLVTAPLGRWSVKACEALDATLERAEVIPSEAVRPDVVTMNSRVRYAIDGQEPCVRTLVYPWDADITTEKVSVLAPLGSALLGQRVGSAVEWPRPDGSMMRVRVLDVLYQPEAQGHSWL